MSHNEHGSTVGAVCRRDEVQALRAYVVGEVDVLVEHGCGWIAHVVHEDATGSLETHKGVGLAEHFTDDDAFWLCAFVVVSLLRVAVNVFTLGDHQRTDAIAAVPHQGAVAVPDAEGTGAVGTDEVQVAVIIGIAAVVSRGGLQTTECFLVEQVVFVRENSVVQVEIIQSDLFGVG